MQILWWLKCFIKKKNSKLACECFNASAVGGCRDIFLQKRQYISVKCTSVLLLVCEVHIYLCFQALVYDHSGQNLEIELFDEDTDKDDFLGRYSFCSDRTPSLLHPALFPPLNSQDTNTTFLSLIIKDVCMF